jgi:hypothetical protein
VLENLIDKISCVGHLVDRSRWAFGSEVELSGLTILGADNDTAVAKAWWAGGGGAFKKGSIVKLWR